MHGQQRAGAGCGTLLAGRKEPDKKQGLIVRELGTERGWGLLVFQTRNLKVTKQGTVPCRNRLNDSSLPHP